MIGRCVHDYARGYYYIPGGMDHLPNAFMSVLNNNIIFNARVRSIQQSFLNGVTVKILCTGIECHSRQLGYRKSSIIFFYSWKSIKISFSMQAVVVIWVSLELNGYFTVFFLGEFTRI
jgi:hypothetical protein